MDKVCLELKDLTIGYKTSSGPVVIQDKINTTLRSGEFVCLLGSNGAGKTTLLRTIASFMPPLAGSISINGKDLKEFTPASLSRQIGIVLTERPSVSAMTVEQLVALGRSPYTGFWGRLSDLDKKIVADSLAAVNATAMSSRLADTLSDGERQKVMIAKVLAQQTPFILLDEPTAFLDYPNKAAIMRLMRDLAHEKGKAVLLSTHDLNMALSLADKVWLADKHSGFATGTPRELAADGTLGNHFAYPGLSFNKETLAFTVE